MLLEPRKRLVDTEAEGLNVIKTSEITLGAKRFFSVTWDPRQDPKRWAREKKCVKTWFEATMLLKINEVDLERTQIRSQLQALSCVNWHRFGVLLGAEPPRFGDTKNRGSLRKK